MLKLLRKVHFVWYMFWVALIYYILSPLVYFNTVKPERYPTVGTIRYWWCRISMFLSGLFTRITFEEPIDYSKTYVYIANHSSYLDTPMMCFVARGNYHFMGKVELLKNPVLRRFFQTIDVPVDRSSKIAAFRAMKKVQENLGRGSSLILYPEGTMAKNPPELGEFKNGAFKMAIDSQVAVIPVTFLNNYVVLPGTGKKKGSRPGVLKAYVHKPIETKGLNGAEDEEALKNKVFNLINTKLQAYAN